MSQKPRLWQRWLDLLDHREPATGLALLRIALGWILVLELGSVWARGLAPVLWMRPEDGGYRSYTTTGAWLIDLLGGPEPSVIYPLMGLALLSAAALILGVCSRVAAFVALQTFLALTWINGHAGGSYDPLITNLLWLVVLADSGSTGSLHARWRTGTWWPQVAVPAWPRYLVMGQLVVVYTSTGLQKVSGHWLPGGDLSALYYIMQQPSWQRIDMSFLAWVYPLTRVATLGTWLFEVGSPVLLLAMWFRATHDRPGRLRRGFNRMDIRTWWLVVGVLMHVGVLMTMSVGSFSLACLAAYPCFFHAEELRRLPVLRRWLPPPSRPETVSPQPG